MTPNQRAFARAIKVKNGQVALAGALGTAQSNISFWLTKAKRGVPPEWALKVEAATGVSRHELRPDIYGPAPEQAVA